MAAGTVAARPGGGAARAGRAPRSTASTPALTQPQRVLVRREHARDGGAGRRGDGGVEEVGGRDAGRRRGGGAEAAAHPEVDDHDADRAERDRDAPARDQAGDERFEHASGDSAGGRAFASEHRRELRQSRHGRHRPRDPRRAHAQRADLVPRSRRRGRAERERGRRPRPAAAPRRDHHRLHGDRRPGRRRPRARRADRRPARGVGHERGVRGRDAPSSSRSPTPCT